MKKIIPLAIAIFLVGCSKVRSLEYYTQHQEEATRDALKCELPNNSIDPGSCLNARKVHEDMIIKRQALAIQRAARGE